jgi:hypothetical protein
MVKMHSVDPDTGYFVREDDHREDGSSVLGRGILRKIDWGYETTLVVTGADDLKRPDDFPSFVVAMAPLHKPGHDVGANAIRALRRVNDRGHPAGLVGADRAYSSAKADEFQLPARALGYQPVFGYKKDQLGVKYQYGVLSRWRELCTVRRCP